MKATPRLIQASCLLAILTLWVAKMHAQLTWVTNNGTIEITGGCPSSLGAVVIPEAINGLPVTAIGAEAFSDCTNLTSITIPNSVTSIGESAFAWCENLTSAAIPNSVTNIGNTAFGFCKSLGHFDIPIAVSVIADWQFVAATV